MKSIIDENFRKTLKAFIGANFGNEYGDRKRAAQFLGVKVPALSRYLAGSRSPREPEKHRLSLKMKTTYDRAIKLDNKKEVTPESASTGEGNKPEEDKSLEHVVRVFTAQIAELQGQIADYKNEIGDLKKQVAELQSSFPRKGQPERSK